MLRRSLQCESGKAPCCDGIPPEVIKAKGEVSEEVPVDLCNWIWNEEKVLEERNKVVLIKLQKKGNLSHSKS